MTSEEISSDTMALLRDIASDRPYEIATEAIRDRAKRILAAVEPSKDLVAARDLAAAAVLLQARAFPAAVFQLSDAGGRHMFCDDAGAIMARIVAGQADQSTSVQMQLIAIEKGRELERDEARRPPATDMVAAPRQRTPDHLTVTIDGPQGSGKTKLGNYLRQISALGSWPAYIALPRILEMRDGRPFDVRNDAFVEG